MDKQEKYKNLKKRINTLAMETKHLKEDGFSNSMIWHLLMQASLLKRHLSA